MTERTARRCSSAMSNVASSSSKPSSFCCTGRPTPCSRTIFGGPSKAQNMITMRPFSRRWATVSMPLPIRSTYANPSGPVTWKRLWPPFGDRFTWPSSPLGAVATKNIVCASMNSRSFSSICSNTLAIS